MNERIKLLAEQARQYAFEKVENSQTPTEWSTKYYNEMFEEKFAELIGRECLTLADSMRDNLDEDGEKQQALGAAWVGLAITRHFGFEE